MQRCQPSVWSFTAAPPRNQRAQLDWATLHGFAPKWEEPVDGDLTEGILTSLFDSLKSNILDLRRDLALELRDLRTDLTLIGKRVSTLEDNKTSSDEGVELLRQEIIHLHEQQDDVRVQEEDLENRSQRNNIHLRGVHVGAKGSDIRDYTQALFCSMLGREDNADIELDRVHSVAQAGGARP
ncbi:hypothetical protein NDU88_001149 [Pleurodeles waltl]|uniref:Uncharacterized protein n=1 Tax=Pleurodeles waltl TaxID=8319 RepID=A0AAV7LWT5_PLEWA|nr:hypothetical protein NDU88_001149 [Pleurodeles waltl]